jgi:hypothetical protein
MLKGGDNGPALVPGDPEKSLLIKAVRYADRPKMPPRSKLSDQQIADLTAWVKMGAPWPGGDKPVASGEKFDFEKRRRHWSFQPVKTNMTPPAVKGNGWVRNPLDNFIVAKLEARGLKPASMADRRTLLRRVTLDLTGLPPTPEEIDQFVNDSSADCYEKLVDRLLASPAYGERWGRHWLDLMRFAETSGHEFDFEIHEAHRYRDAVVRAFDDDVPYDRFVREHVAGDLIRKPRREPIERTNQSVLLTGFWFLGESKHSPVDLRVDGGDRRDNMIDVFGKAFLGLTISCARCHDHKFDPIYTKDYYGLVSYVQSSRQQMAFIDHPERVSVPAKKAREARARADRQAVKATSAQLKGRLDGLSKSLLDSRKDGTTAFAKALSRSQEEWCRPWRVLGDPALKTPEQWQAKKKEMLAQMQAEAAQARKKREEYRLFDDFSGKDYAGWFVTGDSFGDAPAGRGWDVDVSAEKTPRVVRRKRGAVASGKAEGALRSRTFTIEKKFVLYRFRGHNVRVNLVIDNFQQIRDPIYGGLTFPINGGQPRWHAQNVGMWVGQKAYVEVLDDGDGWCELEEVWFSDHPTPPPAVPNASLTRLVEEARSLDDLAKGYEALLGGVVADWNNGKLTGDSASLVDAILASAVIAARPAPELEKGEALARLFDEARRLEQSIPKPRRGLAIADGDGNNERVHNRGNPKTLKEEAPRQLPVVIGGSKQPKPVNSGRLEMAERLTSADNPLLARVFVNRLWHHHFGAGLVRSVDDFGHQGTPPSHPELLDWLASKFIRQGYSVKAMHRLMVLSATYRQSSRGDADAERADPKNELLHKMPIRRLEAEAVRDSMLAVSGRLDRTRFGRGPMPHLTEFMLGRGRPGRSGPLDGDGRRSLYLEVRRNFLEPMFLAFDYPVPFSTIGRRSVSNVPAQALTLLNNPFVIQQARLFAERTASVKDDEKRIGTMYELAYGRAATRQEMADAKEFLSEQAKEYGKADERAWADLAHVLFNVKEFIFVN